MQLLVFTGLICGMLTYHYLAVADEQEGTQSNSALKELHEEIFCDLVRIRFCVSRHFSNT